MKRYSTLLIIREIQNYNEISPYTSQNDPHQKVYKQARTYDTAHGTLLNVMWQPGWERSLGENGYMMAESLHCSPETITILLIRYTQIENKTFKLKKEMCPLY